MPSFKHIIHSDNPTPFFYAALIVLGLTMLNFLVSCATVGANNPRLNGLQQRYQAALQDPVLQSQTEALERTKFYLDDAAFAQDEAELQHHIYLIENYLELAKTRADTERDDLQVTLLQGERDRLQTQIDAAIAAEKARIAAIEAERKRRLEELQAIETTRGVVVTLGDLFFQEPNRMRVNNEADVKLGKIAAMLQQNPRQSVLIEAYVNNTGTADFLSGVSQRLADNVSFALIERGVSSARLSPEGRGKRVFTDADGKPQKRWVEITLLR